MPVFGKTYYPGSDQWKAQLEQANARHQQPLGSGIGICPNKIDWAEISKSTRDTIAQQAVEYQKVRERVFIGIDRTPSPHWNPQPAPVVRTTSDIEAALNGASEKHRQEHIWNMIVLAAESSRV